MRYGPPKRHLVAALAFALLLAAPIASTPRRSGVTSTTGGSLPSQGYPTTSWAVGIVVPEGAPLQDGERVRWEGISNVTAMLTLPNITEPDGIVYAVLSLMTSDGNVLQGAVGIRPGESDWSAYAWAISGASTARPSYQWVLNASEPEMAPRSNVTISIYSTPGSWRLRVSDATTGDTVEQSFPRGTDASLSPGDQEVFALESYSRSSVTFRGMGNLTLGCLSLDGENVTGGVYAYSQWDPDHNPLFVVGSSGADPPSFISIGQGERGAFLWSYTTAWGTRGDSVFAIVEMSFVSLLVLVAALGVVLWKTRGSKKTQPKGGSRPDG